MGILIITFRENPNSSYLDNFWRPCPPHILSVVVYGLCSGGAVAIEVDLSDEQAGLAVLPELALVAWKFKKKAM